MTPPTGSLFHAETHNSMRSSTAWSTSEGPKGFSSTASHPAGRIMMQDQRPRTVEQHFRQHPAEAAERALHAVEPALLLLAVKLGCDPLRSPSTRLQPNRRRNIDRRLHHDLPQIVRPRGFFLSRHNPAPPS